MHKIEVQASGGSLSLNEFFELARQSVDPRDPSSLLQLSEPLHRLAQNKDLLAKFINHDLANWEDSASFHFYSPQSCRMLGEGPLLVRANLWPVLPSDPRRRAILSKVLSYYDFHDHNFSFITANYFGPGYETEIYRYEPGTLVGYPGEDVELRYMGRHTLDDSCVLFLQESSDVHQQLPPPDLSASLNLMLTSPRSSLINQYYFDPQINKVIGYVESFATKRIEALSFAAQLGDQRTQELLEKIILVHPCARTRFAAGRQLLAINGWDCLPGVLEAAVGESSLGRQLLQSQNSVTLVGAARN